MTASDASPSPKALRRHRAAGSLHRRQDGELIERESDPRCRSLMGMFGGVHQGGPAQGVDVAIMIVAGANDDAFQSNQMREPSCVEVRFQGAELIAGLPE